MAVVENMKQADMAVCIPYGGRPVTPQWATFLAMQNWPLNLYLRWHTTFGMPIAEARELMVKQALEAGCRYLLFLDDDVQPPMWGVRQLFYTMNQHPEGDVAVVTGVYWGKCDPTEPIIYKESGRGAHWNWKMNDVFEIAECGAGCMLINLEVLKDMPRPWFQFTELACDDFKPQEGGVCRDSCSEDVHFCRLVRAYGKKILCDSKVQCLHWDVKTGNYFGIPEGSYPAIPRETVTKGLSATDEPKYVAVEVAE